MRSKFPLKNKTALQDSFPEEFNLFHKFNIYFNTFDPKASKTFNYN